MKRSNLRAMMMASRNDDLQYCGTYGGQCEGEEMMSVKTDAVVFGDLNQDPTRMAMSAETYMNNNCDVSTWYMSIYMNVSLAAVNDISKTFNATINTIQASLSQMILSSMNCTPGLVPSQQYNVMDVSCLDEEGKDMFQDFRDMIGTSEASLIARNATSLIMGDEDPVALPYVSAEGCSSAPTQGPTTQPPTQGPTTQPPTQRPTTQPPTQGPTTLPPTQGPTTQPPTQGPTTLPPTQGPTTVPPSPKPTVPPTVPPTPKPTKKPINMMIIYIAVGVVAIIVLAVLIGCCCKGRSKNTNNRVHRVNYQTMEAAPLKKNYVSFVCLNTCSCR